MRQLGRVAAVVLTALLSITAVLLPGGYLDEVVLQTSVVLTSIETISTSSQHSP
jgi:hypothetical protein